VTVVGLLLLFFSLEGEMKFVNTAVVLGLSLALSAQAGEVLRLKAAGVVRSGELSTALALDQNQETGLYVVQWKDKVHEEEKAELKALGFRILNYIPDDAFLAQGSFAQAEQAARLGFVRAVVPYGARFKLEPELAPHGVMSIQNGSQVSVQMVPGADLNAVKSLFTNATYLGHDLILGSLSGSAALALAQRADVIWVERYLPMRMMSLEGAELGVRASDGPPPAVTGYESGNKLVNVDAAYVLGMHGEGQILASADTGTDTGDMGSLAADFQGQLKAGLAMGVGGSSWGDPMCHGTHTAGSIVGNGKSSNGQIHGGSYGAQFVEEGMWSDIMNNIMPPSIPDLFDAAYAQGARIHSDSWGAPSSNGRYDNWSVLADTWLSDHPDFLALFASGNDGSDANKDGVVDEGSVSSPGTAKNVLTVGASKNYLLQGGIQKQMKDLRNGGDKWGVEPLASSQLSEDPKGLAAFSSRGPTADGRLKPDIVSPGTNIVSVRSHHPKADATTESWGIYDANYLYMGGTSMATPIAAGAMGLFRQFLQQKVGADVSAALLKAAVANTADDLYPGQFGERAQGQEEPTRRPNNHEGWGRVDVANLVGNGGLEFHDEHVGLSTGQSKEFDVTVDGTKPLKVTMAYTDAPGTAAAARTLVNDLDLTVVDANGKTYFPNGRSDKDAVNNMEEIDLLTPAAGTYKVIVTGANVPQGKNGAQAYGLVISK
jgi:serine protease AprX